MVPNLFPQPSGSVLKQTLVSMDAEEKLEEFESKIQDLKNFDKKSDKELALEELTNRLYVYLSNPKVLSTLKVLSKALNLKDKVVSKLKNKIKYFQ